VEAMNNGGRILIVDDDARMLRLVREVLSAAGYEMIIRSSGEQAIEAVALEQPNLIVLDIMLKDMDGFRVARRVREFSDVPIIMLTAKVTEMDKLAGFDAGADDYVTKPFSSKELLARVRAVLKRTQTVNSSSAETQIVCGNLSIDLARRRVAVEDQEIYLTATEYNLLHELAQHVDQVLLHEQLLTAVWGAEYRNDVDYLRSYVHSLRKKLEVDPSNPKMIVNIPGVGYSLATPESSKNREGYV
jgi:two-component system KDP operon response regulator KdpE